MTSTQFSNVVHLTTNHGGPLSALERQFLDHQVAVETWFREQWRLTPPSFYSSVDLRNAGYKIAPVDTNLFPAGFNNLNPDLMPLCIQAIQSTLALHYPDVKKVLLIPESHTRNLNYLENVAMLRDLLTGAGFQVRLGSLSAEPALPMRVELPSGQSVELDRLERSGARLGVHDFEPDLVILNNDLSVGIPPILQNVAQPIIPPPELGWANRLKSSHFQQLQNVVSEFANQFHFDPWTMSPLFSYCGEINFMTRAGEDCLARHAERLLTTIAAKYKEHNIKDDPFVVVKSDAGTYGMSVMMVKDPDQLRNLNRKQRTKMASAKGGQEVSSAIVQEGVYTYETSGSAKAVAEPVVYMIGPHVVGGFYRVHKGRGVDENLNAPGMNFEPLAFADAGSCPSKKPECNRFYSYGVVARLAALAAAREVKEVHDGA